eukprot:GFUD01021713.1.p1 GENE.GFUD01021713.1~~GFUD01021713.1.p1  ORF type:complete len:725 (+),score=215.20 GFUD01021713.1:59-2233(+)
MITPGECITAVSRQVEENPASSTSLPADSLPTPATPLANLFGVPALLSHVTSSNSNQDYVFIFMHQETEERAVLKQSFLTALEKDGVKMKWDKAKSHLKPGCPVKIDVTQSKTASIKGNWLVLGLYFGDLSTECENKESPFYQRRRLSKEFDWMKDFKNCVNDKSSFRNIENQLADIEDSVFVYNSELNSAEKALVEVRETLDDCMIESDENYTEKMCSKESLSDESSQNNSDTSLSLGKLNETFTVEDSSSLPASDCLHKYEVGVVLISVTSQCLHLVGPLNDIWVRSEVSPTCTPVYVKGGKMKNSKQVSVGDIGTMVSRLCVKCQLDTTVECLAAPLLVWFGEEPGVRSGQGVVVWREEGKVLVKLDGSELVLFKGSDNSDRELESGCKVLVWGWRKAGTCAEGGAWVLQASQHDEEGVGGAIRGEEVERSGSNEGLDLSTDGIFSPSRATRYLTIEVSGNESRSSVDKTESDKCSDISFGSVSECDEVDPDKSFNTNLSNLINSTFNTAGGFNSQEEEEFQALYARSPPCFPDEVDIDLQFEQVLAANGLVANYDDLAKKYEDFFAGGQPSTIFANPIVAPVSTSAQNKEVSNHPPPSITFETCPPDVLLNPSLLKKMSCPSLSPIPEEVTDNFTETPVFSTPVCRSSEDSSGYNDSFCSGSSNTNPFKSMNYSAEKIPAFTQDFFKQASFREMLQQFLEFTQFPESSRNDLIDHFLSSN